MPVQNLRNGLRAVLSGTGSDGALELRFIPLNADFQNGDRLATSGIDGVYPPGLAGRAKWPTSSATPPSSSRASPASRSRASRATRSS